MDILITAIGEDGGLPSLTCHTDLTACCRSVADNNGNGSLGQWTYPNGSVILRNGDSATAGEQFYIIRGAPQVIGLYRREATNPVPPTGSYCCTVPTTGGDMTLCANLGECRGVGSTSIGAPLHLKLPYLVVPSLVPRLVPVASLVLARYIKTQMSEVMKHMLRIFNYFQNLFITLSSLPYSSTYFHMF